MGVISLPTTFTDGTVPTAAQFNGDFTTIANEFNGNIDNANVKSAAAITESKIAFNTSTGHVHNGTDSKLISVNRGFGFFVPGVASVANDLSWNPTSPQAVTAVKLWAYARTAPVGSSLTIQIYNVTQAKIIATLSITAGSSTANTTSMTNAAIAAGDVLRCDITVIGSSTAGSNVSVLLECSQP